MANTLRSFADDLIEMAIELDKGKEAKKFLGRQGTILKNKTLAYAKSKIKKKEGKYFKSFKRTRPHKSRRYKNFGVVVKSTDNKASWLEDGHYIYKGKKDKGGVIVGYSKGLHIFENTSKNFEREFYKNAEDWAIETLKKGMG